MERRAFVTRAGSLAAVALAGCLSAPGGDDVGGGDASGSDDGTDTASPTDRPDDANGTGTPTGDDPTGTDPPEPGDPSVQFEVRSVEPGNGENDATVAFGDGEVTVEGTIAGNNGCYTARLAAAEHTGESLRILVEAYEDRDDDEMCTQSLVDVDYVAMVGFGGAPPDRVVVEHDSLGEVRTVADVTR